MSLAGGPWLLAEPHGGGGSDGCAHGFAMSGRPSAMELAAALHHSWGGGPVTHDGPRAQKAASGGGARVDVHGEAPDEAPPPHEPDTQYYGLNDDDSVPELSGGRPDPVLDPGPPVVGERHSGVGYEILLDVRVPQLNRDIKEFPHVMELDFWEQVWRHGVVMDSEAAPRLAAEVPKLKAQWQARRARKKALEDAAKESRSSNKVGGRRKRKKRRGEEPGCGGVRGGRGGRGDNRVRTA